MMTEERRKVSVLTVGDGDFSCSLALLRAYDGANEESASIQIHHLVATSLIADEQTLRNLYPNASNTIQQLQHYDYCKILFGVDATCLCDDSRLSQTTFDYILFHHPHLGYNDAISPTEQTRLHRQLVAAYIKSSRYLLKPSKSSFLHVCLCGKERSSWDLDRVLAAEGGLELAHVQPASRPIFDHQQPQYTKPSRTRRGHWLGRYGYRHQPTDPQTTQFLTNVSTSQHYFIQK